MAVVAVGLGIGTAAAQEVPELDGPLAPDASSRSATTQKPGADDPGEVAGGEEDTGDVQEVVVTATRIETPTTDVASSVTVITGEEIRRRQAHDVLDVLRTAPSLDVVRSGGLGQNTAVFIRGAKAEHTLVLIDGIEANDPSSPSRAFDFANLTAENIERVEVLRGPQSTLWGSDAIGGVINIITKRGRGRPQAVVSAEAGSYRTFRETASVSGGTDVLDYSLSLVRVDSRGFSSADRADGNREDDGFEQTSASARVGVTFSDDFNVDFVLRSTHTTAEIDDFGGPGGDDPDRELESEQTFLRVQPRLVLADGGWEQALGLSLTDYGREDDDEAFPGEFGGQLLKADWQHTLRLLAHNVVVVGAELERERFDSDTTSRESAETVGFYLQDQLTRGALTATAGARYDDHSEAGDEVTYRLTAAYLFDATRTRVKGSYGTGFKAPALFQLFSSFGSPDLQPERSRGWDVGVEQELFKNRLTLGATYFQNDLENLIDFDFVTSTLGNVAEAETRGVELVATLRPTQDLTLRANYTYTDTENVETGQRLLRRAAHKAGVNASYRFLRKGDVTLSAVYVGARDDIDPVSFGRTTVDDYVLLNLAASYALTQKLTIFGRVENLLDEEYQEVAGFGTAGFSLFGGVRLTF